MAFVNEFVPEADKSRFDPAIFFRPLSLKKELIELYRWTVDRERDIFLIRLGGGGYGGGYETPDHYALSIKGQVIKFDLIGNSVGSKPEGTCVINWDVLNLNIPNDFIQQQESILALVEEALDAMGGSGCDRNGVLSVNVNFKHN